MVMYTMIYINKKQSENEVMSQKKSDLVNFFSFTCSTQKHFSLKFLRVYFLAFFNYVVHDSFCHLFKTPLLHHSTLNQLFSHTYIPLLQSHRAQTLTNKLKIQLHKIFFFYKLTHSPSFRFSTKHIFSQSLFFFRDKTTRSTLNEAR